MMKRLIVAPAWAGDMVMAQSLFKLLKKKDPHGKIGVLVPASTRPLLEFMPEVDHIFESPFRHRELRWTDRYRMGLHLQKWNFDQAIVLANSFKSALIPYWARIPQRTGWLGEYRYFLLNDIRYLKRAPVRLVDRYRALGISSTQTLPVLEPPLLEVSARYVEGVLNALTVNMPKSPVLALCPGAAFGPAKCWPADYYAQVARQKLAEGWAVWLFGSSQDQAITKQIFSLTEGKALDFGGKTTLAQAVALLSLASVVVANDSGLLHIGAALQRPVVGLYGSTTPKFAPPLSAGAPVQVLYEALECSPCRKRICPLGHFKCMKNLYPEKVLAFLPQVSTS